MRKSIEKLIKAIDHTEKISKDYYKEMLTKFVMQQIKNQQIQKLTETFKEIDFVEPGQLINYFGYKTNDQNEQIRQIIEVIKEYREGKNDPNRFKKKK